MLSKEEAIARLKENPLDRERWIEVGKSMGWESIRVHKKYDGLQGGVWGDEEKWLHEWHDLIDHLAEGGTIESYFEKL